MVETTSKAGFGTRAIDNATPNLEAKLASLIYIALRETLMKPILTSTCRPLCNMKLIMSINDATDLNKHIKGSQTSRWLSVFRGAFSPGCRRPRSNLSPSLDPLMAFVADQALEKSGVRLPFAYLRLDRPSSWPKATATKAEHIKAASHNRSPRHITGLFAFSGHK